MKQKGLWACPPPLVPGRPAAPRGGGTDPLPGRFPSQAPLANCILGDFRLLQTSSEYRGIFQRKTDGPGLRFGERRGKQPLFLTRLEHLLRYKGNKRFLCPEQGALLHEQRGQAYRAAWSERGLKKHSWGAGRGLSPEAGPLPSL